VTGAVVVDAVRTPLGMRNGGLSGWHPADLAAEVLAAVARRGGVDPALVEEVVVGCATPVGEQGLNLGRSAVLAAGWPESVPATTVDRQGASSLQAVAFAAHGVAAGAYGVAVAAGVEVTSTTPPGAWTPPGSRPFSPRLAERYAGAGGLVPPGVAAERLAERWGFDREELDRYAAGSRRRAHAAAEQGRLRGEMVPVAGRRWDREAHAAAELPGEVAADEGPGRPASDLSACKPTFEPGGGVTAGNSGPPADGAAAVLVVAEDRLEALGARPLALVRSVGVAGVDPLAMLTGVVPATSAALARAGLTVDDVDRFEVDESFACIPLVWLAELGADPARVNVNGGAIALGHPPGCSGARLLTTLVHELDRSGGRLGLAVTAGIGGVATAILIEAL
jgi:acetyl-CoA acyltransferase